MRNIIYPIFLLLALLVPYYRRWSGEKKRKAWEARKAELQAERSAQDAQRPQAIDSEGEDGPEEDTSLE
jgi:hypothetical protein